MKLQIRGGNAAIYRNGEVRTDASSGCPRMFKLRSYQFQPAITEPRTLKVFKIGQMFEDWYGDTNPQLEKEREVRFDINEDVEFIGHIDYSDEDFLYELKSVTSKNTFREVFKKQKPKMQNVLQLATYMVALERDKGKLIYGSFTNTLQYDMLEELDDDKFEEICDTLKPDATMEFNITISDSGIFSCNGQELDLQVADIVEFWEAAAEIICDEEVPAKPAQLDPKSYFGPCSFCELKNICANEYDSWDQFYHTVKNFVACR